MISNNEVKVVNSMLKIIEESFTVVFNLDPDTAEDILKQLEAQTELHKARKAKQNEQ